MKVLITGASGFIGSHLVRSLRNHGSEIILLKRSTSNCRRIEDLLPTLRFFDLDRKPLVDVFQENPGIDAIVHVATCYGRGGESASAILEANTLFPLGLLELASQNGVKAFLNTDTFFADNPSGYGHLNVYTVAKRQFAEWGRQMAAPLKIAFLNLKLFHVYGPLDGEEKFATRIIRSCLSNEPEIPLTPGEQKRDFIFVHDVVDAFRALLDYSRSAPVGSLEFQAGTGRLHSIRHFVESVHGLTHSKSKLLFGALPYRENEFSFPAADSASLRALGWKPAWTLESGLEATVKSLKSASASERGST
jgi:CDP-paratose synthetase